MLKRFGKVTINLDHISVIEQLTDGNLSLILSNGREYQVKYDYSTLIDYINYTKR